MGSLFDELNFGKVVIPNRRSLGNFVFVIPNRRFLPVRNLLLAGSGAVRPFQHLVILSVAVLQA
jgi:hypothetical protein